MRMRTARGMRGSVAGLAAALALLVAVAPRAVASGPTSVLVVSPESEQTASLYVSDAEYGELERCLGTLDDLDSLGEKGDRGEGRGERPPGLVLSDASRQINVTWMVHDVRPWRVDRAYPASSGAVWIHTTTDVGSMKGTWHRAKDPARLTALFKRLGVMGAPADKGRGRGDGSGARPPGADSPLPSAAAGGRDGNGQAASGRTGDSPGAGGTDWWWAVPGAAAGAAGALLLRAPLAGRRPLLASLRERRPHEDGPRRELRDL